MKFELFRKKFDDLSSASLPAPTIKVGGNSGIASKSVATIGIFGVFVFSKETFEKTLALGKPSSIQETLSFTPKIFTIDLSFGNYSD